MKKRKNQPTVIYLTDEQRRQLSRAFAEVCAADASGKPGMLLGQFETNGRVRVGFIQQDQAQAIQKARGNEVGQLLYEEPTHSDAPGLVSEG